MSTRAHTLRRMAKPVQSAKSEEKPLPLLKSLGMTRVGEYWAVYELHTRGDVVVSRKLVTEGQNKPGAAARLKDESDYLEWWTPGAK